MADDGGRPGRRAGRRWLWAVAGVAAAGAVCAVVGVFHLPARMYTDEAARAALQGGLLTAAAALTAVAGGLVALDETRQANAETRRANANTHVRELYVEAVKLLNDADIGIRLGGIYALERVAVDSPADQRTVVEVLSAFVRVRSTDPALRPAAPDPVPGDGTAKGPSAPPARPAVDVHAAVTVLARLPVLEEVPRADLTGADLTGPAAVTSLQATDGNLAGVDLTGADLTRAGLGGANLTRARLDWANLTRARLGGANLTRARLGGANLTRARLGGANLTGARLVGANLTGARLVGANLTYAGLDGADLTYAGLDGADLTYAGLDGADLTYAGLDGADLTRARGLTGERVAAARGDARTRLPDGVARPASWPPYDPSPDPDGGPS